MGIVVRAASPAEVAHAYLLEHEGPTAESSSHARHVDFITVMVIHLGLHRVTLGAVTWSNVSLTCMDPGQCSTWPLREAPLMCSRKAH